jgi:hypothetical protein
MFIVIVQWEAPNIVVKKEQKFLGVVRANPNELRSLRIKKLKKFNFF